MDEWKEIYDKAVLSSGISVHIKDRMLITQVFNHITMKVFSTSDAAISAANTICIGFKDMDEDLKRDLDWFKGI